MCGPEAWEGLHAGDAAGWPRPVGCLSSAGDDAHPGQNKLTAISGRDEPPPDPIRRNNTQPSARRLGDSPNAHVVGVTTQPVTGCRESVAPGWRSPAIVGQRSSVYFAFCACRLPAEAVRGRFCLLEDASLAWALGPASRSSDLPKMMNPAKVVFRSSYSRK